MENILITGAAGFIGSNFVNYMVENYKYNIIVLDKLTYAADIKNIEKVKNKIKFIKGDICNYELVDYIIKEYKIDTIVNFAAETHVDRSILNAEPFIKTDVFGTYTLLELTKKNKIEKFLQISTDEVYGSIENGSFKEEAALNPSSPYSASKASADMLVNAYYITYKLPVLITRTSNNFGMYQHPEKLVPLTITNLLRNKKVPVYGDGLNVRDWIFVIDNCRAIDLVLHKGKIGEIYNISAGNEIKNIELVKIILKEMNKDESYIQFVKDRPGHDRRYSINSEKIKSLGFKIKYQFKEALKETIEWYKNNKEWWENKVND